MWNVPTFPNDNEKGLSVVTLQVTEAYWAYTICTNPHFRLTSSRSFAYRDDTPDRFVPMVVTEHPKRAESKFATQLKHGQLHVYLVKEGTIICQENRNITRQKPHDTLFFKRVASASKIKLRKAKTQNSLQIVSF